MYADMASKRDLLGGFSDSTLSALAASTKASSILSKHAQSILAGPSIYDGFVPKMGEYSGLLGSDAGIVSRSIQENILDIDPIRDMPPLPHIDNPLDGTNNKIDKTNNKLDKLIEFGNKVIPIIPDAANVLNTMSQSVISMQADLFKSSQKAARLSLVMLAIAALTLIAGVFEVQDWFKDEEAITSATIIAIQKGYEDQLSIQSQETESLKLEIKKMKSEHEAQLEALRLELRQFNKVKANTNQLQKSK